MSDDATPQAPARIVVDEYGIYTTDDVCEIFHTNPHQVMAWREAELLRKCAHLGRSVRFTGRAVMSLIDALDGESGDASIRHPRRLTVVPPTG